MDRAVICFYWQGDRWRSKDFDDGGKINHLAHHLSRIGRVDSGLASKYINNLHASVRRNTTHEIEFICYTNEVDLRLDPGIKRKGFIPPSRHGVLPRIYMFSEDSGLFGKQVLCLDIDLVITGSLDDILGYDGQFCTRAKFKPGETHKIDGDIMGFRAGPENEERFWTKFIENKDRAEAHCMGRERYWIRMATKNTADIWQKLYPGQIASYKRHVRGKGLNNEMRIVSFHGKPRPHQAHDPWIKKHWRT